MIRDPQQRRWHARGSGGSAGGGEFVIVCVRVRSQVGYDNSTWWDNQLEAYRRWAAEPEAPAEDTSRVKDLLTVSLWRPASPSRCRVMAVPPMSAATAHDVTSSLPAAEPQVHCTAQAGGGGRA